MLVHHVILMFFGYIINLPISNLGIVYRSDTAFTTCKDSWTTGASITLTKGTYIVLRRAYANDSQKFLFGHGYNAGEYTSSKNSDINEYVLDVTIEVLAEKTTVRNYVYGTNSKVESVKVFL